VAVNVLCQAQVKKPGKITVLARKLFDIVKEAAGAEITIKTSENDRVEITSRQMQCKIVGLSANEFPKLPDSEGEFFPVETAAFQDVLEKVSFAMSTDETRYHLNGVYVEKQGSDTVFVSTDGHRLSLMRTQLRLPEITEGIIIPRKGVNELRKAISALKAFEFSVGKKHAFVRSEKETLFIRLIDGDFPNYRRVIPESTQIKLKVPREELIGALKRVSLLSDEYSKGVKLYFCNGALLVNTANLDVGEAKEELALDFKGEAF
jgi:DNA polymerase-3 subunit beta